MDSLKKQRASVKGKITRLQNFLGNAEGASRGALHARLAGLEESWVEYNQIHNAILALDDAGAITQQEGDYVEVESKYYNLKADFTDRIDSLHVTSPSSRTSTADIKLPRITLPTFTGNALEWSSFHDLFCSLIHNNVTLSDAQKLHYLKSAVAGEAAALLQSIEVTDVNYLEAWALLIDHYQNERQLIQCHLNLLFGQKPLTTESASSLRGLLDNTAKHVRALHALKMPTDHWDQIIVFLVTERLDSDSRRQWELSSPGKTFPTFTELRNFLEQRCRALEASDTKPKVKHPSFPRPQTQQHQYKVPTSSFVAKSSKRLQCMFCNGDHLIYACQKFLQLTYQDKTQVARKHSLCFNCLRAGHASSDCTSGLCRKCGNKHHTLLHFDRQSQSEKNVTNTCSQNITDPKVIMNHHSNQRNSMQTVLLSTAVIKVTDALGRQQQCRVLLDSGSQANFFSEACVQRLGLRRSHANIPVIGISGIESGCSRGMVELQLQSNTSDFSLSVKALILNKVTGQLPSSFINVKHWSHISHLTLADPEFNNPSHVDILLGAEVYFELLIEGRISVSNELPTAVNTKFGWILSGKVCGGEENQITAHFTSPLFDVQEQLRQFWELEEVKPTTPLTPIEKRCEDLFLSSYTRDDTGRFTVKLPIEADGITLGNSKEIALKRLLQVERRLSRMPVLREQYNEFMKQYLDLGHMEPISTVDQVETPPKTNYLPHHFVTKESSSTTALRVVFDASAKTTSGTSLNDNLLIGPQLQDDIWSLLLRFRLHKYAFTADIEKMYRQVKVSDSDTDLQRILWRDSPSGEIKEFRLTTLTYGTASAPYLATKTLQQLAIEEGDNFPLAKEVTIRDFYMDDLMSGVNEINEGLTLQTELTQMLQRGGFRLRKWASNEPSLLESLPQEFLEMKLPLQLDSADTIKALGLNWHPAGDYLFFKVSISTNDVCVNKRRVLSDVSKIFDPLGLLAPAIIVAKIILQKLWIAGVDWDKRLPPNLETEWLQFREELPTLQDIKISRCVITDENSSHQLHGFCDASEHAYGAVVYLRSEGLDGTVTVHLLCAKTRVAPVKQVSLPRLELCGAVLLSRLLIRVQQSLRIPLQTVYAWTDSTITLAWISGYPRRWKTFVANRVSEIQENVSRENWHHVSTKDNPADIISRGLRPSELSECLLWWKGPSWLSLNMKSCERSQETPDYEHSQLEERTVVTLVANSCTDLEIITRFSSLAKLKRVVAYCRRFIYNARHKESERKYGPLTINELQQALTLCIGLVQQVVFSECRDSLVNESETPKNLQSLNPFMDKNDIIRVGGRLRHARRLSYDQRFPILLPKRHHLSELIIRDAHINQLHAGPQLTLAALQQRYWIINGRSVVRNILHQCHPCFRDRAATLKQQMGDLPHHRVEPARPFLRTGVDYGGPVLIKSKKGRGGQTIKAYIALFVCFSTKAIHLELVSDLSTEAFIAALRRFISRRGRCTDIYSDNASNFVGAASELRVLHQQFKSQNHNSTVTDFLAMKGVKWHYIPPKAPHFGGLWEAGIKSVKTHLRRIVGGTALTFEELYTVLTQIEACLNSRPLSPMSTDPNDFSVLTPGHFLVGDALTSVTEPDLTELKLNTLSRWQLVQRLTQQFWKRWQREYLCNLQQRPKWTKREENIRIGDLVLIKEDNVPSLQWIKGRVLETHPGSDGCIRVATIKTERGLYKRPTAKLCILPPLN